MVIEKDSELEIENVIGRIFHKYNIFEYKSPEDELGVDEYAKLLGYACLYKAASPRDDSRKFDDITVSMVRDGKPAKLIQWFADMGCKVDEKYKGIYYISGDYTIFPTQIIVTSLLDGDDNIWLRSLINNLSIELGRKLVLAASKLTEKDDKEHADSLLQVAMERNIEVFKEIKEEPDMCEAFNTLMKPELDAARAYDNAENLVKYVENAADGFSVTIDEACSRLGVTVDQYRVAKKLLEKETVAS